MNTNEVLIILVLLLAIIFILINIKLIIKIKNSREVGVKLSQKNWYYKMLSKFFIKNLPS